MPDLMERRRSGWAVLAVCALIASLLAAGVNPATAVEETADHLAAASACAGEAETDHMFTDVPEGHIFRDAINCIAHHGITVGTGDGTTFSPNQDVTRWQMALFIARAMKAAGLDLGAVMDAGFTDIGDAPAVSRDAINQLATNGVIAETGTYRPNDPTTRADMAILLVWVPIIRSWALTRGFALHPGTRNRYEIRYTRTQHRPPSRQVNDHGRVFGTHVCPEGK